MTRPSLYGVPEAPARGRQPGYGGESSPGLGHQACLEQQPSNVASGSWEALPHQPQVPGVSHISISGPCGHDLQATNWIYSGPSNPVPLYEPGDGVALTCPVFMYQLSC